MQALRQSIAAMVCAALVVAGTVAAAAPPASPADEDWHYTVRPGDNPWNLTERYLAGLKYWPKVQQLNRIADPTHIPPGTELRIPQDWLRAEPAPVRVEQLAGHASVQAPGDDTPAPLAAGALLGRGAVVRTAADGSAELAFGDGSRLRLLADGELRIARADRVANTGLYITFVELARGHVEALAEPLRGTPSRFVIATPSAVTSVRGTVFRVAADPDTVRAETIEGTVEVSGAGDRVAVGAGFGTLVEHGAPPAPPVALLAAPDLSALPARLDRVPVAFQLAAIAGAAGYRMQIARDPQFAVLDYDGLQPGTALRGPDLPDGAYHLRVRAIDARGLEGLDGVHDFVLKARPEAPVLAAPDADAQLDDAQPQFRWAAVAGATGYRFELAGDAAFATRLEDVETGDATALTAAAPLAPGRYYWRVTARDAAGPGPTGDTQAFRRLAPGPDLAPAQVSSEVLLIRWRAGTPGQSYAVQVARDATFGTPAIDRTTPQPELALAHPQPGGYYVRVRTIDADGYAGSFGAVQRIDVPAPRPSRAPLWWILAWALRVLL